MTESVKLLFLGTEEDKPYLPRLKPLVGVATVFLRIAPVNTIIEIVTHCKQRNITGVISTNKTLLKKLVNTIGNIRSDNPSLDDYAGSLFKHQGIEFVFIFPLEQLVTVPHAPFLTRRFISKLTEQQTWKKVPIFSWELLTPANYLQIFDNYQKAFLIGVDTETVKENCLIDCVSYTALFIEPITNTFYTHTCVLEIKDITDVWIMRKFNWELQPAKVLQNGKYDWAYFARLSCPLFNSLWDTQTMFHCWYSELPKDLGFLGSFFIRDTIYWKELAETTDRHEFLKYSALDTYNTVIVAIMWILQSPEWAKKNYSMEFPILFPSHMCEMRGIKRDMKMLEVAAAEITSNIEKNNISLSKMVGTFPAIFNVNSAPQNKALRTILGCGNISSSDENHLKKIGSKHPLNRIITNKILDLRGDRKLISTYLVKKEFNGRILYSINPHGTDTGRNASREHHFWCGLQIHNIPQGKSVKQTLCADDGFVLFEADLKQAESRDTAYISGDEKLIENVESSRDFHSLNCSAFFGMSYEEIYSDELGKTLNKEIRNLGKRINHGANYNMGEGVLADTMGDDNVWEAKRLLKLPRYFGLLDVTKHLLACFHKLYPGIKKFYYTWVIHTAETSKLFVGATGWTRFTFLNPKKNKLHLNSLIAHNPQSLIAMKLNIGFLRVFHQIALHPEYKDHFKLLAQIHDSILFQVRIGYEFLAERVAKLMEVELTIKGCDGKTRTYSVPADLKGGKDGKGVKYWSDTEG